MTKTLSGYTDCAPTLDKVDTASAEHVRQTIYRALRTRRGMDREEPGRWTDIGDLVGSPEKADALRAALAGVASDLLETDDRIEHLRFLVGAPKDGSLPWRAIADTSAGVVDFTSYDVALPQNERTGQGGPLPVVPPKQNIRSSLLDGSMLPGWMSNPELARIVFAIGLACDAYVEWVWRAIQQRFPLICEPDALLWIGRDRQMFRGEVQDEESYRLQLTKWLQLHKQRGHPWALLTMVQKYFATFASPAGPLVRCVEHHPHPSGTSRAIWSSLFPGGVWQSDEKSPSNWLWDTSDAQRPASLANRDPRFWIIIYRDPDVAGPFQVLNSTGVGEGMLSNVIPDERYGIDLKNLERFWRAAGAWPAGLIIAHDATLFEPSGSGAGYPDGTWNRYADPGNNNAINRVMPALYLEMSSHTASSVGV